MNYSAAHYRDLANYDTLVLPLQASIAPLIGDGLERWYINQVIRQTYLAVTRVGFMCCTSTSAGGVMLQVLPPRPVSPVDRPVRPILDEFGCSLPPTPRRRSKLNILRRVRPVLLAMRAARATYFAAAWVQYEQMLRRAADPFAAQAARLKQCAEHLLGLERPLSIIATGQTPDIAGQYEKLPTGQRYYFPMGWPVREIARLLAEIQLFDRLSREFEVNVLALPGVTQPLDTPAALVSEWNGLLCQPEKFGLTQLLDAFRKVGLLSDNGEPTEWGRTCKGAWAGALDALTTPPALLTVNALAAGRCLASWGIVVSPNTLRNNTSAEADNTRKVMNRALAGLRR